jgi:hypothetical protein
MRYAENSANKKSAIFHKFPRKSNTVGPEGEVATTDLDPDDLFEDGFEEVLATPPDDFEGFAC